MSILDIFKATPAPVAPVVPAAATNVPANPGNIPAQDPNSPATLENPVTPPNGVIPAATPELSPEEVPLEPFKNLWETVPNVANSTTDTPAALNPADVQKAMAKADFSSAITPEQLAAITAGGEEASAALPQILNALAQQVMVQSTMVNNKLAEKSIAAAIQSHVASLPDLVRSQTASNHLRTTNPLFNNPAIKPVIKATQQQLLQKFPNATPAELTDMTQKYILAMGEAFAPKAAVNDNAVGDTDWAAFMEAPTQ